MINGLKKRFQNNVPELNTLDVLLQSLKYQLKELDLVNKNIDKLKLELKGESNQEKKGKKGIDSEQEFISK